MKKYIYPVLLLLGTAYGYAQTSDTTKMTLRQSVEYALNANVNVQNAVTDESIYQARVREALSGILPQANGTAYVQSYGDLRRSFIPPGSTLNPGNSVLVRPNFLQVKNTSDASVNVSQLIFSASFFVGLKAAKTYVELSKKSSDFTRIQVIQNVSKAYYTTLINKERLRQYDNDIIRLDSLLSQTRGLYKVGLSEKIDVSRLSVNYNNLISDRKRSVNLYALSILTLKYQMGFPLDKELLLTDSLSGIKLDTTSLLADKIDFNDRVEYSQLLTQRKLQRLDAKSIRMNYLPTLSASGTLGIFTQAVQFSNFYNSSLPWYRYDFAQLTLNVPIFDGFAKRSRIQQSKLNLVKLERNIKDTENAINLEIQTAITNFRNSIESLETQKSNVTLAKEVAKVTQARYNQGIGTNLEVVEAENSLLNAQTNYYSAYFDALVSKLDYDQAIGSVSIK